MVVFGAGPDIAVSTNRMIIRRSGESSARLTALEQREGSHHCRLRSWSQSSPTEGLRAASAILTLFLRCPP
jgi:hypothetical protein